MITNQELRDRAIEFAESYFKDMSLISDITNPSIIHQFLEFELDGVPILATGDFEIGIDIYDFKFQVGDPGDGFSGEYNTANMAITIAPEFAEDDSVLLHELIHAFEYLIEKLIGYSQLHDVVLLCLYNGGRSCRTVHRLLLATPTGLLGRCT